MYEKLNKCIAILMRGTLKQQKINVFYKMFDKKKTKEKKATTKKFL